MTGDTRTTTMIIQMRRDGFDAYDRGGGGATLAAKGGSKKKPAPPPPPKSKKAPTAAKAATIKPCGCSGSQRNSSRNSTEAFYFFLLFDNDSLQTPPRCSRPPL